jgi:glycolate oxidase FAD binding subunit
MRPTTLEHLVDIVASAAGEGRKLELRGGGTKAAVGSPREADILDLTGFSGIIDYDPAELVLTAGAGARLDEIEAAVAERGQMLGFEPYGPAGATLGGVMAAGVSGPRRLSRGSARDHLLGFKAVSGRGEAFVGGAKVVKNVTGYDLPKVMAGSWGRLAALTEITVKVLPQAPEALTLAIDGLAPAQAVALMAKAMGSQADVAAAAHAPGFTAIRLEGFGPSVAARRTLLDMMGEFRLLQPAVADAFWNGLTDPMPNAQILWRLSLPAGRAPEVVAGLDDGWIMDWAGGLVWAAHDDPAELRAKAAAVGGHALLWRAPGGFRAQVPVLQPQPPGVEALEARVRRAFDPMGVFETGRF